MAADGTDEGPYDETVTVAGERFRVTGRPGEPGVFDFEWLTGRDPGYGFFSAGHGPGPLAPEELEECVRGFLSQVDPATGHIED